MTDAILQKVPRSIWSNGQAVVFALIVDPKTGKARKQPFHAKTLRMSGWDLDPADFGTAAKALRRTITLPGGEKIKPSGVGIILGRGGLYGVDLDSCIYSRDGKPKLRRWAKPILDAAKASGCWIEKSISGTGLHIVGRADEPPASDGKKVVVPLDPSEPPPGAGAHEPQVDLFVSGYFTISGRPVKDGLPSEIGPIGPAWQAARDLIASVRGENRPGVGQTTADDETAAWSTDRKKGRPGGGSGPRLTSPLDTINDLAVARLDDWFGDAFPDAERQSGGSWKLSADLLGRDGSDHLSAKQGQGIVDFWAQRDPDEKREGARTPIDMLISEAYEPARSEDWACASPKEAGIKLAQFLDLPAWIVGAFKRDVAASGDVSNIFTEQSSPLRAPPWPRDVLPGPVADLAGAFARTLRAHEHLVAFTHFAALAAAIPGGVVLDLFGDRRHVLSAALYAAVVGGSGSGKSPAWKRAQEPLFNAEAEWSKDHARARAAWQRRQQRGRKRPEEAIDAMTTHEEAKPPTDEEETTAAPLKRDDEEPKRRRRLARDVTTEALVPILAEHDAGIILSVDEMTGFVGGLDKYARGSRGGSSDSAVYLSAFDGAPIGRDRVRTGSVYAARAHLSILTGVQPAVIAPLISNLSSDGLLQRFLWCVVPGLTTAPRSYETIDAWAGEVYATAMLLLLDLRRDGEEEIVLTADPGAIEAWRSFDDWVFGEGNSAARSEVERNVLAKAPAYAARIALALELITWAVRSAIDRLDDLGEEPRPVPAVVGAEAMRRAVNLMRTNLLPAARIVFEIADADTRLDDAKALARALRKDLSKRRNRPVTIRDLGQIANRFRGRANRERLDDAVVMLEERNILVPVSGEARAWNVAPELRYFHDPGASDEID